MKYRIRTTLPNPKPVGGILTVTKNGREYSAPVPKTTDKTDLTLHFYDPFAHGVTQSLLSTWQVCREKFRWQYNVGYSSPEEYAGSMAFGTLFHYVLSVVYGVFSSSKDIANKQDKLYVFIQETLDNQYKNTHAKAITDGAKSEVIESIDEMYAVAEVLIPAYFKAWIKDYSANKWVDLEKQFEVPYPLRDGRTVLLKGKIDGIFRGVKDRLVLFETKTKGLINEDIITSQFPYNLQVQMYTYAAAKLYQEDIAHIVYNVVRRPLERRKSGEDIDQFQARIKSNIEKNPAHYFIRFDYHPKTEEIKTWQHEFDHLIHSFVESWENAKYWRNDNSCNLYNRKCPFLPLCSGTGDKSHLTQRDKVFAELE